MSPQVVSELSFDVREPAALGIDAARLAAVAARARREVDDGLLPSCQVAIARHGVLAGFWTFGDATPASRYTIFSATKPITNSVIWMALAEGLVTLETRVADLVPEFGTNGKDVITLEQVILQTSGFPNAPLDFDTAQTREGRLGRFAKWRLNHEPGERSQYHPTSAHWVLAEVIERVYGEDYRSVIRRRVAEPLGIPHLAPGVPIEEQGDVIDLVAVGEPATPEELAAANRDFGEVTVEHMLNFNQPHVRSLGVPAGGALLTAADLALFYQGVLHDPARLWDPDLLADATSVIRNDMFDAMLGRPASLGLGVSIKGTDGVPRGFGESTSAAAYGWPGAGGQVAWVDPATGLSFAYLTNGLDRNLLRSPLKGEEISTLAGVVATS
jgi:CubicO group peptidase (beta-lactamase class C family)